jgi:NTE family protein
MKRELAFVFGGGGARGALQVGALRALLEADYHPDILVGCSAGAFNAALLAINGVNLSGVTRLAEVWQEAVNADLLPANYLWLTVRSLFNRPQTLSGDHIREMFIHWGLATEICFTDIRDVKLLLVAADLNGGCKVLYGNQDQQPVIEGVLASCALPPWITPIQKDGQLLIDGGVVSNVPIEPAISLGAKEIIVLDLTDDREQAPVPIGFGNFFNKLSQTVQRRELELEKELAEARHVTLRHIHLTGDQPVNLWDFTQTAALLDLGYETTRQEILTWKTDTRPFWAGWLEKIAG